MFLDPETGTVYTVTLREACQVCKSIAVRGKVFLSTRQYQRSDERT